VRAVTLRAQELCIVEAMVKRSQALWARDGHHGEIVLTDRHSGYPNMGGTTHGMPRCIILDFVKHVEELRDTALTLGVKRIGWNPMGNGGPMICSAHRNYSNHREPATYDR
jgi:hypothetical protein